jgi:hypothetical protein
MNFSRVFSTARQSFLIVGFLLVSLFSWAFASPIGASPDEDYHLVSIWCAENLHPDLCIPSATTPEEVTVPATLVEMSNCFAFVPEKSANCPVKSADEKLATTRSNADGGYPPVFYAAQGIFASENLETSVITMRLFNSLVFALLFLATLISLPKNLRFTAMWGFFISAVPLGMFIISSVNPSSWAVISASVLWISLVGFFQTDSQKRKISLGAIAFLATVIGSGSRSDAAVYSAIAVLVAIVLSFSKMKQRKINVIIPIALIFISILFFFSGGQSSVISNSIPQTPNSVGETVALALANLSRLPELWVGALGTWGLGWLDTQLPGIVWVTSFALFIAFVFSGLKNSSKAKGLSLSLLFLSLIAIPLYILVKGNIMVGSDVQPRYIYPIMIIFVGVALYQLVPGKDTFSGLQLYIAATGLTIANSIALHVNLRRYVTGIDVQGFNLESLVEWWWQIPVGPMWVWALGSLAFGIAVFSLARYSRLEWSISESAISKA